MLSPEAETTDPASRFDSMIVVTADGRRLRTAAAVVHLAGKIWWARPVCWIARWPWGMGLVAWFYKRIAENRYCFQGVLLASFRSGLAGLAAAVGSSHGQLRVAKPRPILGVDVGPIGHDFFRLEVAYLAAGGAGESKGCGLALSRLPGRLGRDGRQRLFRLTADESLHPPSAVVARAFQRDGRSGASMGRESPHSLREPPARRLDGAGWFDLDLALRLVPPAGARMAGVRRQRGNQL